MGGGAPSAGARSLVDDAPFRRWLVGGRLSRAWSAWCGPLYCLQRRLRLGLGALIDRQRRRALNSLRAAAAAAAAYRGALEDGRQRRLRSVLARLRRTCLTAPERKSVAQTHWRRAAAARTLRRWRQTGCD